MPEVAAADLPFVGLFVPTPSVWARGLRQDLSDLPLLSLNVLGRAGSVKAIVTQLVTHHDGHGMGR